MSFMSWFGGPRRDPKQAARDAIIGLRQQLQMIEKKEEYLQKRIDDELKKAKANAVTNKAVATQALKRKKANEAELDRLAGTRLNIETQVNTLESANLNQETMYAMKKGAEALKVVNHKTTLDEVDATMNEITAQKDIADEIANIISNPLGADLIDDDELEAELNELEQDALDERLKGAEHVPLHQPQPAMRAPELPATDEEEELRQLQASMAM